MPHFEVKYETFALEDEQHYQLWAALNRARQLANHALPKSALLSLICMDFLATNDFRKSDDPKRWSRYFSKLEALMGKKIVVIDPDTLEVVHGYRTLERIAKSE